MRNWTIGAGILALLAVSVCAGPATEPAGLSGQSSVEQVLDALDARGKSLRDFSGSVKLSDTDNSTGDSSSNTGTVILQRKGDDDARVRVAFTRKQLGEKIFDVDHQYTLDDGQLVDRDYDSKHETRRQMLKPGQKLDLFKLGDGPFPLPLGQKKEDVLKLFDVEKVAFSAGDPAGTVHLHLTPKPDSQFARQFKAIDIWVDPANDMPRRIQTVDPNEVSTRTTDLTDIKINAGASDKDFAQPPLKGEWDQIVEPYGQ